MRLKSCSRLLLLTGLLFAWACKSGSSVSGTLISTNQNSQVPANTTITVQGKSSNAIQVQLNQTSGTSVPFQVSGLQSGEPVIFRVANSNLDTILSFPFTPGGPEALELAAVPAGTIQTIINNATTAGLIHSVSTVLSVVGGEVDPLGQGTCQSVKTVQLRDPSSGTLASSDPPIYFDSGGTPVRGGMADAECTYIFFNVQPGTYSVEFVSDANGGLSIVGHHDVFTVANQVSFGFGMIQ